jgi:hypothetical protein
MYGQFVWTIVGQICRSGKSFISAFSFGQQIVTFGTGIGAGSTDFTPSLRSGESFAPHLRTFHHRSEAGYERKDQPNRTTVRRWRHDAKWRILLAINGEAGERRCDSKAK